MMTLPTSFSVQAGTRLRSSMRPPQGISNRSFSSSGSRPIISGFSHGTRPLGFAQMQQANVSAGNAGFFAKNPLIFSIARPVMMQSSMTTILLRPPAIRFFGTKIVNRSQFTVKKCSFLFPSSPAMLPKKAVYMGIRKDLCNGRRRKTNPQKSELAAGNVKTASNFASPSLIN